MWFNAIKGWIKKAIAPTHSVPGFPRFTKNRVYIVQYKNGQFSIWHSVGGHNNQSDCNTLTWFMVALLHILHFHCTLTYLQFNLHTTVDSRHEKEECSISPTYTWSKKRVQPLLIHLHRLLCQIVKLKFQRADSATSLVFDIFSTRSDISNYILLHFWNSVCFERIVKHWWGDGGLAVLANLSQDFLRLFLQPTTLYRESDWNFCPDFFTTDQSGSIKFLSWLEYIRRKDMHTWSTQCVSHTTKNGLKY